MDAIRYRTGIDETTGRPLTGWRHVEQSLRRIWMTRRDQMVMRLDFGSDIRSLLGEDITPDLALLLYEELVAAAHRWEPEYRISELQLVHLTRMGSLGVRHAGLYYPEGRLGNYELAVAVNATSALSERQRRAA